MRDCSQHNICCSQDGPKWYTLDLYEIAHVFVFIFESNIIYQYPLALRIGGVLDFPKTPSMFVSNFLTLNCPSESGITVLPFLKTV